MKSCALAFTICQMLYLLAVYSFPYVTFSLIHGETEMQDSCAQGEAARK